MPVTKSPLRYPGGKTQLHKFVSNLFAINKIENGTYCEPFSGGAGVAIELLLSKKVKKVILNDYDSGIYSVWHAILCDTNEFIKMINEVSITIEEWEKQKKIYLSIKEKGYSLDLAFATFFLNRTNRSGIILGGPIGNKNQEGKYKIDCRFNKKDLVRKISNIANERDNINLYNLDAKLLISEVLKKEDKSELFVFFDPPYYAQGKNLYTNFFSHQDHVELLNVMKTMKDYYWITTYDYNDSIKSVYSGVSTNEYFLRYSANNKRKEKEYLFHSETTIVESFDKVELL